MSRFLSFLGVVVFKINWATIWHDCFHIIRCKNIKFVKRGFTAALQSLIVKYQLCTMFLVRNGEYLYYWHKNELLNVFF